MGVPAFFRWLSKKYPSIVVHCVEEKPKEYGDTKIPVDTSLPNPNDYEFDNLYLDMNGIIHPCSHPENKPAPKNEAEMMVNIFEYIDRIFSIVRPRKLLYMAIDGVIKSVVVQRIPSDLHIFYRECSPSQIVLAPRAKMNQQRSRRFRAAKESRESRDIISNIKKNLKEKGALLPPEQNKPHFDSNCITPGTEFMDRLSVCLRYYISDRLTSDPGWKNIKVILSDANVPGEGEHKIMDFVRKQRSQPDHDPNTKHCLNGADADLIMLGLATHEVHFTILREEFKPGQKRPCEICGQVGHEKTECEGLPKDQVENDIEPFVGQDVEFIFIRLNVLREYLERELKMEGLPFYDFERALDDWVFMCFFVGNDFLPHLPSLEIREGAIDRLVRIYKNCLPQMGGYLADSGVVNLKRVQRILKELGEAEDEIFRKRQQFEESMKRRRQQQDQNNKRQRMEESPGWSPRDYGTPLGKGQSPHNNSPSHKQFYQNQKTPNNTPVVNKVAASDLRSLLMTPESAGSSNASSSATDTSEDKRGVKRSHEDNATKKEEKKPEEPEDHIRLWEEGWKERYYLHKFAVCKELDAGYFQRFRKHVANEYVLGLCWVLQYYYQGCQSWNWFYPFHYAPFASDFLDVDKVDITFAKGTAPFRPLEQLMSVFPAASGNFLPPTWRELMMSPESPIIDFYPTDFKIDLNGKRFAWQGVALLPFVDEKRLHRTLKHVYDDISDDERRRNTNRKTDVMFVRKGTSLYDFFTGLHESGMLTEKQDIVTDFSNGVRGKVFEDEKLVTPESVHPSPVPGQRDLSSTQCFSVRYEDPLYDEGFLFPAKILEKATMPERTLKPGDFPAKKQWTPRVGMNNHSHTPYHIARGGHRMVRQELGFNQSQSPHNNNWGQNRGPSPYQQRSPYGGTPPRGGGRGGWNQQQAPWGRMPPPMNYQQNDRRGGGHQRSFSQRDRPYQRNQHDDNRRRSYPNNSQSQYNR